MAIFEKEIRYTVLKNADVDKALLLDEQLLLNKLCTKVAEYRYDNGKLPLNCVVVEQDWPEYYDVWNAIETRCNKDT
jgi:hypothetical protein